MAKFRQFFIELYAHDMTVAGYFRFMVFFLLLLLFFFFDKIDFDIPFAWKANAHFIITISFAELAQKMVKVKVKPYRLLSKY